MDIFKSLTTGTHFKGNKNKPVIDLFRGSSAVEPPAVSDLFSEKSTTTSASTSNSRKGKSS